MEKKTLFKPGDLIRSFTGQHGVVISQKTLDGIKNKVRQGRRPGYFFAAGCCDNVDYLLKVPVFFDDGTYDIMKPMNIKKADKGSEEKKSKLEDMLKML